MVSMLIMDSFYETCYTPNITLILESERMLYSMQVAAILSFAAACSAGAVVVLFERDVYFCKRDPQLPCGKFEVATAFAFLSCTCSAASALVMFWLLASL
jgi:hypothetical protein